MSTTTLEPHRVAVYVCMDHQCTGYGEEKMVRVDPLTLSGGERHPFCWHCEQGMEEVER